MAVTCSWADAQVRSDPAVCCALPPEVLDVILTQTGTEYVDALATASLRPSCTDRLFTLYEPLIVEITARWLSQRTSSDLATDIDIFSGLARVLPLAPYLKPRLNALLGSSQPLRSLRCTGELSLVSLADQHLLSVLLAWFRLLTHDVESFAFVISPLQLSSLIGHTNLTIRCLAIHCISLQMMMSDDLSENLLATYVPNGSKTDTWEGRLIDYRWLKLFEEERWGTLEDELYRTRITRPKVPSLIEKGLTRNMLSSQTAELANILIPRSSMQISLSTEFVHTLTTTQNLKNLAQALLGPNPILLAGKAGSGKTSLINEAARELNKFSSMVTLHLNEQTDAKSLIGLHTTSTTGGSFVWQPGILTKAMEGGKWVVIEDIDRAPAEVIGVLLPLIDKGVLFLPNRREQVRAADGFRILATIRHSDEPAASQQLLPRSLLGSTGWKQIQVHGLREDETSVILYEKFPLLKLHMDMILRVIYRVRREYERNLILKNLRVEVTGLRALLKWCHRINSRLKSFGTANVHKGIPESFQEDAYMDALDCFAGHLPTQVSRFVLAESIAEEMHISPQHMDHYFRGRTPSLYETVSEIKLGRATFPRLEKRKDMAPRIATSQPFASTRHSRKVMESLLAALMLSEPLLLVGDTGIGKTAIVQYLARAVNQKLTVINLSQQSESSDLLGGFKPITTRSLALPLFETFNDLFGDTFSAERNQNFQSSVARCVAKQNWRRLLLLWQEAINKAQERFNLETARPAPIPLEGQPMKRRRLALPRIQALQQRWTDFSTKIEAFSIQVSRGDTDFAFAFVEGKIVNAVRNGEWILFDEINLASPDTLDSIASLLRSGDDGLPFLLLPEAGNLERVMGHPSLRIFAAMNPATDVGKKDLAPGLRARFTEIFVPSPDDDLQDLISLVRTYLGSLLDVDERAASDLARLYLQIKKLNDENYLTDGAGDRPHFSIRSLVRCLMYVMQNTPAYGLRRAMYEGAAMSFLTVLSKDSAQVILPVLDIHILSSAKNVRSLLSQVPKAPSDGGFVIFKHHWLQQGPLTPQQRPQYIITPFVERNLLNLARATTMKRFPILLQGPTSSGKTSMVEHLARVSGHYFVRINNHEHTDLQEYLGFYASDDSGKLQYKEGILVQALRKGHWIVLDELNLAPTDVLEALNRLLDDNRELLVPESQEIIKPHPNFMLFATQNPAGAYGGRKRLSRAFRNRFLEIHFDDIPEDELEIILRERTAIAPSFCSGIVSVYKRLALLRQSTRLFEQRNSFVTLRDLFRWALRRADDRQQLANNGFMLLAERVRDPAERQTVKSTIEDVLQIKVNEITLYGTYPIPGASDLSDGIVWTPAMKRSFALVSEAIAHNEPVLLIGETGCGKTQVCQIVARAAGRRLQIYNAHANTETGDLIGAQRPTRNKAEIESQLREDIEQLLSNLPGKVHDPKITLDELIHSFEKIDMFNADAAFVEKIRRQIARYVSLFEWADGSLVRAMKYGDHFLLDEISLAEDSVLERLNSVLEPERTLLLAEKGPTDSSIVAGPDFQFLATMNPGGDYGKRELSAALRNRFTEIWVPPLTDDQDILPILQSKLQSSVRDKAQVMIDFAKWFKPFFENAMTTSISLRNLLSWSDFVRATPHLTVWESIVHGAAMVYIDTLGANPSGIMSIDIEVIDAAKKQCLDKLSQLLQYDASAIYHRRLHLDIGATVQIGCFHIDAHPASAIPLDMVFDAPTPLQNSMRVVRALQVPKAILLEGNPGAGKTALVTTLARIAGKSLVRINLSDQTDLMDLFGADVPTEGGVTGSFSWRDGPLLQAMQSGAWVLLDEMNLASQSILEGLNSCLDHRQEVYISELDRTFRRHPNFMLFAAQNPHHKGGGRKGLPASFINRFTIVYTQDFKAEDISIICQRLFPIVTRSDLANVLTSFFEVQKRLSGDRVFQNVVGLWDVNLRDITRWLQLSTQNPHNRNPLQGFDIVIGRRFRTAEQRAVLNDVLDLLPSQLPQRSLYHNLTPDSYQVGSALLKRNSSIMDSYPPKSISAPANLLSTEALMICVSHAWPGILVGPAGCGKSAVLRNLAATVGTTLIELPMNAETDIMDLIGGFEQCDARNSLFSLRQELCQVLKAYIAQNCLERPTGRSWELAMNLYEQLVIGREDLTTVRPMLAALSQSAVSFTTYLTRYDASLAEDRSSRMQFQWVDGTLVEAVEHGFWIVLENANLCSASVLDRLNSLLEPDGSLIISEQHNLDGHPRLIKPHKDFRIFLTMDPCHGELSPAMRNRSLEIYMPSRVPEISEPRALSYPIASVISRIKLLLRPDLGGISPELRLHITRIGLGHLSLHEHISSHRWLISLSSLLNQEDVEEIGFYQRLPPDLMTQIHQFYTWLSAKGDLSKDQVLHQPIRPIVNPNLLFNEHLTLALHLAWLTDSFISLFGVQKLLENASARARNLKTSEMTILELSFHAEAAPTDLKRQPQRIAAFLELLGHAIYRSLNKSLCLPHLSSNSGHDPQLHMLTTNCEARPLILSTSLAHHQAVLKNLLDFLSDFVQITSHAQLQAGIFQAYLQIAQRIAVGIQSRVSNLSEDFSNALGLLEKSSALRYGRSLLRMWDLWRPITASNSAHVEQLDALVLIANEFDELVLRVPNCAVSYADIRVKLLLAWEDVLRTGRETTMLLQSLQSIVKDMQSKSTLSDFAVPRYFSTSFETLCQVYDLHNDSAPSPFLNTGNRETILLIKAGRKTILHEKSATDSLAPGLLSKIARFAGSEASDAVTRAWRRTSIIDLILKVSVCHDQPLGSLEALTEDTTLMIGAVSSLSSAITSSHGLKLKSEVALLLQQILIAHKDLFGPDFDSSEALSEFNKTTGPAFRKNVEVNHYFRALTSSFLKPAAIDLAEDGPTEEAQLTQAGSALFRVCVALIYLFVPDQPLDPAQLLAVERERYDRRLGELHTKLEALRIFEKGFSGVAKTMEIEMVMNEISALGERPPSPSVARPQETELPLLWAEFSNVISVITKAPEKILIGDVIRARSSEYDFNSRRREASLFQQNIVQTVQRLSKRYRAYADLTLPVIRTLQCLNLAVDLMMLRSRPVNDVTGLIEHLSMHTPLLGAQPVALMTLDYAPSLLDNCSRAVRLQYLDHLTLRYLASSGFQIDNRADQTLLAIMDQFYQEWKLRLTKDQQLEARESKYYSYHGEDGNDEAAVYEQMQELFPSFSDDIAPTTEGAREFEYEPKTTALKLAKLLAVVNSNDWQQNLEELVFTGLGLLCGITKDNELDFSPTEPGYMLPGALLLMQQRWEYLRGSNALKTINIYTDADPVEARKMFEVTKLVSLRMEEILVTWPEHALLHEICTCCREIFEFKISDPLAKMLTKTEKLHQLTSSWQAVASKEFTITALIDQLKNLIVSWRKLELKSWNGLLELEERKCQDNARSWFFVAYEVIIAIPMKIMTSGESIAQHVDNLVITLESFLKHTTSGQFTERLKLVEQLCCFVSRFEKQSPALTRLTSSVTNLLQHYKRYIAAVENSLQDGRTKLKLAIGEQILSASWRDTSVTALRDSANRSHHSLFKVVRQYRALLLQPIKETFNQLAVPESHCTILCLQEVRTWALPSAAARALELCQQKIFGWQSRPTRLRDPLGAAASMRQLYLSKSASFNPQEAINAITGELSESIKELKSSTPNKQTEENKSLIHHLKTRKRRLLADVMKSLRHMGVRRNLSVDELSKQSSTAHVLSTTPCIFGRENFLGLNLATSGFHGFLDHILQIRATLHEHSDQLTGSEVSRCVGLAEGLLLILRNQRASLSPALASLDRFHNLIQIVAKLQSEEPNSIIKATHAISSDLRVLMQQLFWLPRVLDLSRKVLEIQSLHTELDLSGILDIIKSRSNALKGFYLILQEENNLPPGLSTQRIVTTSQTAREAIAELRQHLLDFMKSRPHTIYILKQVTWWTELQFEDTVPLMNGTMSQPITNLDQKIREAIDKVFVALQKMFEAQTSAFPSSKDAAWLTKSDAGTTSLIKALHIEQVTVALETALHQVHLVDPANIPIATSLFIVVTPIIKQYYYICCQVLKGYVALHHETCRYSNVLARAFLAISSGGFCGPSDEPAEKGEKQGQIEQGTGLGEGDGVEDVSKDVGEDEDLSELAQDRNLESRGNEMSDAEDAIDIPDHDLEGDMNEAGLGLEHQEGDGADEVEEGGDLEEEKGSIDDLDPSAVDEKLWNDLQNGNEKELENNNESGQASNEHAAANEKQQSKKAEPVNESSEEGVEENESRIGEEDEALTQQIQDQLDPYVQEEQTLGLPEDMQLDGDKNVKDDPMSDDGFGEFPDIEDAEVPKTPSERTEDHVEDSAEDETLIDADTYSKPKEDSDDEDETPAEAAEDQLEGQNESDPEVEDDRETHITRQEDEIINFEDVIGEDTAVGGQAKEHAQIQELTSPVHQSHHVPTREDQSSKQDDVAGGMNDSAQNEESATKNQRVDMLNDRQAEAFKKLADVLDQWHQRREIMKPSGTLENSAVSTDDEMTDADLEHVADDADQGDTQALDAATKEQARSLDQSRALKDDEVNPGEDHLMPDAENDGDDIQEHLQNKSLTDVYKQVGTEEDQTCDNEVGRGFHTFEMEIEEGASSQAKGESEDVQDVDEQFSAFQLTSSSTRPLVSFEEASRVWTYCSSSVNSLSVLLTEQLRLILAPTLATKLRGDFRTGKRLNIKRIIPYIASGYKRDKIWMRRSVPSKRNYQIMLAVDNSKSMTEGGAGSLALESLALLCKSLSMLEVGEICVVGFGDEEHVRVAQPFTQNFTTESGPRIFRHFSFQQTATNVGKLIAESIGLFREARAKSMNANADLWQLELIISDGICEDHNLIRRLVRQAAEEPIMIVFVIVDSTNASGSSILDLQKASYEPDEPSGDPKLTVKRYLDGFPFRYYLIVRDVRDLPGVLATALKSWFAEVADVQG